MPQRTEKLDRSVGIICVLLMLWIALCFCGVHIAQIADTIEAYAQTQLIQQEENNE